jgi:hypothetical protein
MAKKKYVRPKVTLLQWCGLIILIGVVLTVGHYYWH